MQIRVVQWPEPFDAAPGKTVLAAAHGVGLPFPYGCRSGNCGACRARLYEGEVEMLPHSDFALSREERAGGLILACRAVPKSDMTLAWEQDDVEPVAHPLRRLVCHVSDITRLTHEIVAVTLALPDGAAFAYSAGQYARLTFPGCPARDYSMATADAAGGLVFHIKAEAEGWASLHAGAGLRVGDEVTVEGPFGAAYLRENHEGPMLAVAGGSGLAPIGAILERAVARGLSQPIQVYVAATREDDVYGEAWLRELAARHGRMTVEVVLSRPDAETSRRTGRLDQAIAEDVPSFGGWKAYLAGPPTLVEAVVTRLRAAGLPDRDIHADAFYSEAERYGPEGHRPATITG